MTDEPTNLPGAAVPKSAVALIEQKFMAPARLLRDLDPLLEFASASRGVWKAPLDLRWIETQADTARDWMTRIPDISTLRDAKEVFRSAVVEPATQQELGIVMATMLDMYPAVKVPSFQTYVEGLAVIAAGEYGDQQDDDDDLVISAPVAAMAMFTILKCCKFTPAIAEVIEHARPHRNKFRRSFYAADHLIDMRDSAESMMDALGEFKSDDGDYPWSTE